MFGCCRGTSRFITPRVYVALGHDVKRTEGFSPWEESSGSVERERLVLRALEEEEGRGSRGREERERETGIGRVESGRRGKEENTKEKPGWAASLRDRWLGWRDARLLDAINLDHKHRFTVTLGVPRSFSPRQHLSRSPGPFRATHFFNRGAQGFPENQVDLR